MKLVMVGGHTRNIGKTSVVEAIIRATAELNWTAVKITQYGHGVCSTDGEMCECSVADHQFAITEERNRDSGTDTSRFLAAGARRSLWVRTREGELFSALESFRKKIEADEFVIVESNSLRRFLKPTLYLQVVDPANADFKVSAQTFFDLTDAYLIIERRGDEINFAAQQQALLAREIQKSKPCFLVSPGEGYANRAVIDFVKERLTRAAANAA
ncbi:MAG TPA: hypothetical protein VNN73_05530 [Blastocatellia bacterium]|nr:hypothetical protein [Blastocatellia bacterium]